MVGVPRSQGCRNCRRKKKGCDLQKPTCGPCARLNIACGWEEKKWTFVNQEPSSSEVPVRSRSLDAGRKSTTPPPRAGSEERSLARSAFEIGSEDEFWSHYYPRDDPQTIYINGIRAAPWTKTVKDIAALDTTARTALNAISTNILGRLNSDNALLQESTRMYARALRNTNRALQDPVKAQSDAVLACCKILSLYETFRIDQTGAISSQGADWQKHVEGTCRIVELRGPEKHMVHHGHSLFEDARLVAVIAGVTWRKSNFFTTAAWHTIPWQSSPRNRYDKLVDIMIALPQLLEDQDVLSQKLGRMEKYEDRFTALTEGQDLMNRCLRIGESLRAWEQDSLLISREQSSVATQNYTGPVTLLEICKIHGYGFFNICMQFWAASLITYATTWVSYRNITLAVRPEQIPSLPAWMQLPAVPEYMNPRAVASNIVTCAPHYFDAGFWGAQCAAFPMGVALHYYAATGGLNSEEMSQLMRLLCTGKLGGVTSDFLKSLANNTDAARGDPRKPQELRKMATSWYGIDATRPDRATASAS